MTVVDDSTMDPLVSAFIAAWPDFDLQLREKRGLNERLLDDQIDLLKRIRLQLQGEGEIPKPLAEIFVDLWGAMTACASIYDGEMPEKITTAADQLTYYAREICTS
jgi:hypothetical protein